MEPVAFLTVNEERRRRVVDEYVEQKSEMNNRSSRRSLRWAALIMFISYWAVFTVPAMKFIIDRRFRDGISVFIMSMLFSLLIMVIVFVIVMLMLRKRSADGMERLREDELRTTYSFDDGYLLKEYEGDKRKNRAFDLSKISCIDTDGAAVTFEYKSEFVEIPDFYEPSMYDALRHECSKNGVSRV